ncbi:DUF1795 domain-containing protein [Reichenbachiella ulvae]|uniref:DUF1795 domain-containing protein n=1 Tax=Reichenbachiella ulvae TaxID=2980104 RepID=A0ABT3D0B9_9BACT|nr:DUF1795 domain-containing protein [Reichenbachiella ulvae]MCV9389396.1 DUF1795 domain-containing protein [Reichenbachiella ulvae]
MQVLFIATQLIFASFFQNLTDTQVTENITMPIPSGFRPMTDDEIVSKYFTTKKPLVLYTDESLQVDLGVNQSVTQWAEKDVEIMASFQKSNIYNLYDDVQVISEGIKEVNGKQAAYMEFVSTIKPDENSFRDDGSIVKYTYIQYIIVGRHALVFNFTCPAAYKNEWQETAKKIMDGVSIKGKIK